MLRSVSHVTTESSRRPERWAAATLLVVVLAALPHAGALLPGRALFYRDLGLAPGPILEEARRAPDGGVEALPLWTSAVGEGRPLLANPGNALLSPANVLYLLLPFEPAFELFLLLHAVIAAVGALLLAGRLGASPVGAFTAGVAFGLGGFVISSSNLLPTLAAVAWAPWIVAAGLAAGARPSLARVGLLAAALALAALGGQPEPLVLSAACAVAWSLVASAGPWPRRLARVALAWLGAGAWSLLLAAPQVLPAVIHASSSLRSLGFTAQGLLYNSLHPARLPALLLPRFGGHPLERLDGGYPAEIFEDGSTPYLLSLYLGLGVVALAVASFATRRAGVAPSTLDRLRPALAITAALGVLLALGRHLPGVPALVEAVPALVPFRYPVKLVLLAHLALPLLAAGGLERMRAHLPRAAAAVLAGLVALDLLLAHASLVPTIEKDADWSPIPLAEHASEIAEGGGASPGQWRLHHHRTPRAWGPRLPDDARDEQELYRRQRRLLTPAMGAPEGIDHAFDPSRDLLEPLPEFRLAVAIHGEEGATRWLALGEAGVLLVLSPVEALEERSAGLLRTTLETGPGLGLLPGDARLYLNRAWLPRARLVGACVVRPKARAADVVARYRGEGSWPLPVLVDAVPKPAPEPAGATGRVAIVSEDHRSIRLATSAPAPALLVLSDTLAPGWSAWLDGEPTALLRANTAYRAVAVPAGEHAVEMRYRPPGLRAGAAAAALGLLLLAAALVREWRR
jgi:hypothetical protein